MTTQHDTLNQGSDIRRYQEYNATLPLVQRMWIPADSRPSLLHPLVWRILVTILTLMGLTAVGLYAGTSLLEASTLARPPGRIHTAPQQAPPSAPQAAPEAAPNPAPQAFGAGDRLVMAFYYSWFDENTWTYDRLSDLPSEQYVSRDRGLMGRHIDQAKAAGIDAFLLAWYGPSGGTNQTEPNLAAMLDEAAARGFKVGILFETDGPFFSGVGDVTAALQHAQNTHFNHPAYLKVDGRPVVYFWRPTIYGVDTWRNIRAQADPGYSNIWISEGVNTSYLDVFDGHHLYSNTWNPPADLHNVNRRYAGEVAAARDRLGSYKFWVATVMPGYDDVKIRAGAGGFAQDRQGGAYYTRSWDAAIDSNPNWIVINSFNEWPEGSYIEPSVAHGDHYMSLTGQYSGQFKAGGGLSVALAPPAPVEPPPPPEPTPEPTSPTAFVNVAALNLRAGPGTDFPVVTQLSQGAALPITGQHPDAAEWWQVQSGNGEGWVHREFVLSGGPLEQVAVLPDGALPQPVTVDTDTVDTAAVEAESELLARAAAVDSEPGADDNSLARAPEGETESPAITPGAPDADAANESATDGQIVAASITITPGTPELAEADPQTVTSTFAATSSDSSDNSEHATPQIATQQTTTPPPGALPVVQALPLPNPAQVSLHPYLSR